MDAIYRMFERIIESMENIMGGLQDLGTVVDTLTALKDLPDRIDIIKNSITSIEEDIVSIKKRLDILEEEPEI